MEFNELRLIIIDDIRIVRIPFEEILVIVLGGIKLLERNHFGDDGIGEGFAFVDLGNIALSDLLLFVVVVKDYRAILCTGIGTLAV